MHYTNASLISEYYIMQTCTLCNETKPLECFSVSQSKTDDSVNYRTVSPKPRANCKECDAERAREFRKRNKNYKGSGKIVNVPKEDRFIMSAIRTKVTQAKTNNKRTKRPFDIDADYIYELWKSQNNKCIYTGEDFIIETYHNANLSIDKIEPELGYVKGNIQLVCWAVNRAKGDLSHDVFLNMCGLIHERATTIPRGSTLK